MYHAPMDDTVANALAQGRAAWPDVALDDDAFAARVAAVTAEDPGALAHAADLYLACACAAGAPAALAAFERAFVKDVPRFVDRFRAGASFADEVAQLLREKLLIASAGTAPRIAEYAGRGPLRAWVRVAATRLALDLLRERGAAPAQMNDLEDAKVIDPGAGPALDLLKARYRDRFQAALESAIAALTPKQRTLLRMHHVDGYSLDRLATIQRVHRATIARWLADARDEIVTRTQEQLGDADSDFDSVVALVRSQLDLSVSRVLGR
jgi:RNA polymerase sigma-70 factor (ECF subfamily)